MRINRPFGIDKPEKLTLRHLLLFRQAKMSGEGVVFAMELAAWSESVDDLPTLLCLALTVEGDGQSVMADWLCLRRDAGFRLLVV